ncbi:MAG TPA: S46 family peptidase, partial [Flavobacterium sp.]|nr:S46 family peptidase [Flavobacterium sp.]
ELTLVGYQLVQLSQVYQTRGEQSFNDRKANFLRNIEGFYKDFNKTVDQKVFEQLIGHYAKNAPKQFVPEVASGDAGKLAAQVYQSQFTTYDGLKNLLSGDAQAVMAKLNADPGFAFMQTMAEVYQKQIAPSYDEINLRITGLQRTYMKAILELNPGERIFPDANSTLRV